MDIGLNHYGKIHFRLLKTIHWISLIIPIYNTGKFLYKCLDSNIIKGGLKGKYFSNHYLKRCLAGENMVEDRKGTARIAPKDYKLFYFSVSVSRNIIKTNL